MHRTNSIRNGSSRRRRRRRHRCSLFFTHPAEPPATTAPFPPAAGPGTAAETKDVTTSHFFLCRPLPVASAPAASCPAQPPRPRSCLSARMQCQAKPSCWPIPLRCLPPVVAGLAARTEPPVDCVCTALRAFGIGDSEPCCPAPAPASKETPDLTTPPRAPAAPAGAFWFADAGRTPSTATCSVFGFAFGTADGVLKDESVADPASRISWCSVSCRYI
jgi:hypothetical protein